LHKTFYAIPRSAYWLKLQGYYPGFHATAGGTRRDSRVEAAALANCNGVIP
jgi:hypothetical protein